MILLVTLLYLVHSFVLAPSPFVRGYGINAPRIVDVGVYKVYEPTVRDIMEQIMAKKLRKPYKQPRKFKVRGGGSGVVLRQDGVILTAAHVVSDSPFTRITTHEGTVYRAVVVGRDKSVDLALLKIVPGVQVPLRTVRIGHDRPMGTPVYAIGQPSSFKWAITTGVITTIDEDKFVSDTLVDYGASGGGLFDADTHLLVGIVVELYKTYSASVRAETVREFVETYMPLAGR
jgi:S1-C subfamily serine protease